MSKITIILPVYNVAAYVVQCMQSLRAQTLQDIEVIFVDDKGKDNSVEIIQEYIQQHNLTSHWHILHMDSNQGPSAARNTAMRKVKSEYIAFVDADDWIEPEMMQTLYTNAIEHDADISSAAAVLDYPDGQHTYMMNPHVGSGELTPQQRKYLLKNYVSNFTTMLFRREWLEQYNLHFPDANSGEDSSFMGQCYLVARRIAQIDQPYYHYIIHPQSISHRKKVYRGKQKRKAFNALIAFAKKNGCFGEYRWVLCWVYLKKAILSSIVDYLKSI